MTMHASDLRKSYLHKKHPSETACQKGSRIVLIGLDGCGKSSNISRLKKDVDFAQYSFIWVRWKPLLLKPAYWVLKKTAVRKQSSPGQREETKSKLKYKIFKKSAVRKLWMLMALADYLVQFQVKVIPRILMKKKIIFDRYYIDLFVDQGINFGYSPQRIEQEIRRHRWLFPRVDQMIYLRVSPEICLKRKSDIPDIHYLLLREAVYEHLARCCQWTVLDAELSLEVISSQIKQLIFSSEQTD